MWLDSTLTFGDRGQHSFVAHDPVLDVIGNGTRTLVRQLRKNRTTICDDTVWDVLKRWWQDDRLFSAGYISYEAGLPFVGLRHDNHNDPIPAVRFLFFDSVHKRCESVEAREERSDPEFTDILREEFETSRPEAPDRPAVVVNPTLSPAEYVRRVTLIKDHIREGNIYQANFTTRFDVRSSRHPASTYSHLRRLNPAPYGAYLDFGDYIVLSSSPERLFLKSGDRITAGPIKGTVARGKDEQETQRNLRRLLSSEKDRAELLMIVDLVRNDLGRLAEAGSVEVDNIFKPEVYSSVIHLVGDVRAKLAGNVSLTDVLAAMLPGGSITGAPKKRAVEIIGRLEPVPRSVYTGCIGYVWQGVADFNVAIRTALYRRGVYHIHAGSGIVADSDPQAEYEEMCLKARNLFLATGVNLDEVPC